MEVRAEHERVKYASSTIALEPGRVDYPLDMEIFDSTAALDTVELVQLHFIVEQQAAALLVTQVAVLRNTGKRTVAPVAAPLLALRLPAALPFIFGALKVNATLALIGAIVAEFFGSPTSGLGFRISTEAARMNMPLVWGAIVVAAVTGSVAYALLVALERRAAFWHPSVREG